MSTPGDTFDRSTPFDLDRFVDAQERVYPHVLREIKGGRKYTRWMWFIFPQIAGLGSSSMARLYAIASLDEAAAYMSHPLLSERLIECCEAVRDVKERTAEQIFGWPDVLKLCSCLTLFDCVRPQSIFSQLLDQYYGGKRDEKTLELLK